MTESRSRHFARWLIENWWPWITLSAAASVALTVVLSSAFNDPVFIIGLLPIPIAAAIGFTRHERRVDRWKRP